MIIAFDNEANRFSFYLMLLFNSLALEMPFA